MFATNEGLRIVAFLNSFVICCLCISAIGAAISCQHASRLSETSFDSKTIEDKTIVVQIALEHEDGRVLNASAVAPGDRLSLSVTVINVGQRGVFLRTDSGAGPFVDIDWVAADGSNVGWIPPSGEISMPTGRDWARYKYLSGTDEAGEIDGSVRDDQIVRLSREIRIPEETANAQRILLSVWLDLEYAVMRSDGFTSRREESQFRLRPIGN